MVSMRLNCRQCRGENAESQSHKAKIVDKSGVLALRETYRKCFIL